MKKAKLLIISFTLFFGVSQAFGVSQEIVSALNSGNALVLSAFFNNNVMLYAKPLLKGFEAGNEMPAGFDMYELEGGSFIKITETNPDGSLFMRGEPGWDVEFIKFPNEEAPEINAETDFIRHCRMLQTGYGKYYELYVPVK